MLIKRPKLTKKQVEEISGNGDCVCNFEMDNPLGAAWRKFMGEQMSPGGYLKSQVIAERLGRPSVIMRGYESTPGAWVIDDTETGVSLLVFSDGIWKSCYKGTSYEISFPLNTPMEDVARSFERLVAVLRGQEDLAP